MTENKVTIVGDTFPVERFETGLWSLDRAVGFRGQNGIPLRSLIELYGPEHSGKSTLGYYIMSKFSPQGTVWIADLEGTLDKEYVTEIMDHAGYTGTVQVAEYMNTDKRKSKLRSHEEQMQDTIDALMNDGVSAGMIDSLGSFVPLVVQKKDLGERTVGQAAMTIGDASRRIAGWLRVTDAPKFFIYINHVHPNIGGHGFNTPGGETKRFMSNVRLWIRRVESDIPEASGNFLAEVRVQKLKVGGAHAGRKGYIFFIPGFGVSKEMTDVFDCINMELAKREALISLKKYDDKKGDFVWEKMGRIGELTEKAMEPEKNKALFQHFADALKGLENE